MYTQLPQNLHTLDATDIFIILMLIGPSPILPLQLVSYLLLMVHFHIQGCNHSCCFIIHMTCITQYTTKTKTSLHELQVSWNLDHTIDARLSGIFLLKSGDKAYVRGRKFQQVMSMILLAKLAALQEYSNRLPRAAGSR